MSWSSAVQVDSCAMSLRVSHSSSMLRAFHPPKRDAQDVAPPLIHDREQARVSQAMLPSARRRRSSRRLWLTDFCQLDPSFALSSRSTNGTIPSPSLQVKKGRPCDRPNR